MLACGIVSFVNGHGRGARLHAGPDGGGMRRADARGDAVGLAGAAACAKSRLVVRGRRRARRRSWSSTRYRWSSLRMPARSSSPHRMAACSAAIPPAPSRPRRWPPSTATPASARTAPASARLPALDRRGIAAVTVSADSARIGDGRSVLCRRHRLLRQRDGRRARGRRRRQRGGVHRQDDRWLPSAGAVFSTPAREAARARSRARPPAPPGSASW